LSHSPRVSRQKVFGADVLERGRTWGRPTVVQFWYLRLLKDREDGGKMSLPFGRATGTITRGKADTSNRWGDSGRSSAGVRPWFGLVRAVSTSSQTRVSHNGAAALISHPTAALQEKDSRVQRRRRSWPPVNAWSTTGSQAGLGCRRAGTHAWGGAGLKLPCSRRLRRLT